MPALKQEGNIHDIPILKLSFLLITYYLWDIQYKLWYERDATNSKLYQMNIKDTELCEYCQERETNVHAFVLCERTQNFWSEITLFLIRLGYRNFRLEHSILIFGDKEMDSLFNLIIIIAKMVIYQKREKGNIYSMRHFETLIEKERESEEVYATNRESMELYEKKWDKFINIQ